MSSGKTDKRSMLGMSGFETGMEVYRMDSVNAHLVGAAGSRWRLNPPALVLDIDMFESNLENALPHRGGPPVMLVRRFPRSGVHAATSTQ